MNQFSVPAEMVARYVVNRKKEIGELREGLANHDFSLIASKAHNLKGTADSFGFPELGVIGKDLEMAALSKDAGEVKNQLDKISRWLEECV